MYILIFSNHFLRELLIFMFLNFQYKYLDPNYLFLIISYIHRILIFKFPK